MPDSYRKHAEVELIPLALEDIELVRNWRNSPAISQFMYSSHLISEEDQITWFNLTQSDASKLNWIISYNKKKIGLANLSKISYDFSHCYWGFYIADNSVRGLGVGSKVEFIVIDYVFNILNLNKLIAEVFVENKHVIEMHEKFGFRREAFFREHIKKNDVFRDVISIAMLSKEWQVLRNYQSKRIFGEVI